MTDLSGWDRPHYQDTDQRPFVFLAAFGANPNALPLSRSTYKCSGIPDGLDLQGYNASEHADYLAGLRSGYLWDDFIVRLPAIGGGVARCDSCVVLAGDVGAPGSLGYLRDMIGIGEWLFACGAQAIFDPQGFTWWTREAWHEGLFAADRPQPHKHVQILVSDDEPSHWLHTRGMRVFGRPDLSVRNVPESGIEVATTLINRLIAYQALGGVVAEGQQFSMSGLPAGIVCRQQGDLEDPDFNNVHIEIHWPR